MAFRIEEIGSAIFCGTEMYLNLETGRVFPCWFVEREIETMPEHCAKLPHYSATFAPHCYIHVLLKSDPAAIEFMKNSCSALVELQNAYPHCDERVYEMLSDEFCDAYSRIILHAREHSSDELTAKLPTYKEYYGVACKRTAYEWCKKEGLVSSKFSGR